ncbi:arf-GAP with dual PH domain-containing protein 1 isoform X1 [Dermacentor silvarum]|uniref:arf-GAP with dual PH domain-containing protein 1 isoform X1 n=1 Tax=Dermacentor silvarum TaxID=543639 RepID=UPI0018971447|nr:arf-GAP with dual PH domain-containing protein 1 isoform X1 [Dermacentor silvarum]
MESKVGEHEKCRAATPEAAASGATNASLLDRLKTLRLHRPQRTRSLKRLLELLKVPGNGECADCGKKDPEWASYNLGVFLCTECAGIHRSLGSHVSRVRSLRLDKWDDAQVDELAAVGNIVAKAKYEANVPACYRRPLADDVGVVKEQWVRAKYEREEFVHPDRQVYQEGRLEGWLNKQGKEDGRFHPRRFVLSDGVLKYYVKESHKEPKASIPVSEINAVFCPEKIGNKHGLQLSYVKDGSTRNIFVYSEDGKTIVDWYSALRAAKLHHLQVAFPGAKESQLVPHLTRDFLREGWLWKSGPRPADQHRRRWFTLDDRKWMYHEDPLDAYPKGEIFLGHRSEGYSVQTGVPHSFKEMPFAFTVNTPHRKFVMGAESDRDRTEWITVLQKVMERPLTPQDTNMAAKLVRKRPSLSSSLQILKVR